jgi:hypothetical protein
MVYTWILPSMQPPNSGGGTTEYHFKGGSLLDLERLLGLIAASLLFSPTGIRVVRNNNPRGKGLEDFELLYHWTRCVIVNTI